MYSPFRKAERAHTRATYRLMNLVIDAQCDVSQMSSFAFLRLLQATRALTMHWAGDYWEVDANDYAAIRYARSAINARKAENQRALDAINAMVPARG